MENTFKEFREYPQRLNRKINFFDKLEEHFSERQHDISRFVNTESNVGFSALNKLLMQFSLTPFPEHWERYTYPNANLKEMLDTFLRYRNGVAHGGDISSEEFEGLPEEKQSELIMRKATFAKAAEIYL